MADFETLTSPDGHEFAAYLASAGEARKGSVVIVQEIFGVNAHIRDVCDQYAGLGYDAIAPALFDRISRGVELDYDQAGVQQGRELAAAIGWQDPVTDIGTASDRVRGDGRSAVVGYCWGASWAWMAACRLQIGCAVCYYGRHIVELLENQPNCPVMMHFGALDPTIPLANVEAIQTAFPDIPVHVYEDAGHGFNCGRRADFRDDSAKQALARTLAFMDNSL